MTSYYVYSGATGTGTGLGGWTNAFTSLLNAIGTSFPGARSAGDVIYVASDHVENWTTSGTNFLWFPQSEPGLTVLSVNRAGSVPPVAADLLAGAKLNFNISSGSSLPLSGGYFYIYGVTFSQDVGTSGSGFSWGNGGSYCQVFDTCTFDNLDSCSGQAIGSHIEWRNCTWKPRSSSQFPDMQSCQFRWLGGSVDCSVSTPTYCVRLAFGVVEGVDFSGASSGTPSTAIFNVPSSQNPNVQFIGCKMPSGVPLVAAGAIGSHAAWGISSVACDTSNPYGAEYHSTISDVTTETAIVRTGGAKYDTTGFSRKIVTSSSAALNHHNVAPPMAIWNDTVGSTVNVTVHATSNLAAGAFPNNDDIWIEVGYFGDASSPKHSIATSYKNGGNILAANAAYTSDSATWTGSPTGGTFAMTLAITPQKKGYIYVTVHCAKASTTFYVDPLVTLS